MYSSDLRRQYLPVCRNGDKRRVKLAEKLHKLFAAQSLGLVYRYAERLGKHLYGRRSQDLFSAGGFIGLRYRGDNIISRTHQRLELNFSELGRAHENNAVVHRSAFFVFFGTFAQRFKLLLGKHPCRLVNEKHAVEVVYFVAQRPCQKAGAGDFV